MGDKIMAVKLVKETAKLKIYKERKARCTVFYREHKEKPEEGKVKIYKQYENKIVYYMSSKSIPKLIFKDFSELPEEVSPYGYGFERNELNIFFKSKLDIGCRECYISKTTNKITDDKIIISLADIQSLIPLVNQEQYACTQTKNIIIANFFSNNFPELAFEYKATNNNKKQVLRNLNDKLVEQLTADEVEQIGHFYVKATSKYKRQDLKKRMMLNLQETAKLLTLQQVISEYETLLERNPAESEWQKFFEKYITLFDNRYVKQIRTKNIGTGITKYPDLALVDIYGYVDFYELKKSGAKLLDYDPSHKTYYWSKELAKTIAQASDYLQKAKENSSSFTKIVEQETETENSNGLIVDIIRPKAIIVIGHSKELNSKKKKEHFKNLRESLKDIEFVLYDELLKRLNNLLDSINTEQV